MTLRKILFILFALFGALRLYFFLTDDFRLANIIYELPHQKEWEFAKQTEDEKKLLNEIFNQKFYYLGKGAQVYAFASEDDQWVIKFMKFKHLKPSLVDRLIPISSIKNAKIARKERKLKGVFEGYRLAYIHDRKNSGLIYLHFNKTDDLHLTAKLVDKIGLNWEVPLDSTVFILQRKGKTLREVFSSLLEKGNLPEAKEKASQILDMYLAEYQAGVWDRDHGITHNTGFIGDEPIHLDVGKLSFDERMKDKALFKGDLQHVGFKISVWIKQNFPQYHEEILSSIEKHLSDILGEESHVKQPA